MKKREYVIVDRNGVLIGEAVFNSERDAYRDMQILKDHASDIDLPMRVVAKGLSDDVVDGRFVPFDAAENSNV